MLKLKLKQNYGLTESLEEKARLLALSGDETRLRILCFCFKHQKPCVSDIAKGLKLSIAVVSHHLQLMRDHGLLASKRSGNNICYALLDSQFTRDLKKLICH